VPFLNVLNLQLSKMKRISCLLSLVVSLTVVYSSALAADTATKEAVVKTEDYESLAKATDQAKAALQNIQPFKLTLISKLEKLRAQSDADSSASTQYLIDVNEKRLTKIVSQERELKKYLLAIEARLDELRHDPEIAAMLDAERQLKSATTQQEALLNSLPKLPDAKKQK